MSTGTPHLDLSKIFQSIDEGRALVFPSFWDAGTVYLTEHWVGVTIFLLVIFAIAVTRAVAGYWGMLGSFLYNLLFLGTLLIVGIIWGPEIFANNYIKVGLSFLYILYYWLVGRILDWTGLRRWY